LQTLAELLGQSKKEEDLLQLQVEPALNQLLLQIFYRQYSYYITIFLFTQFEIPQEKKFVRNIFLWINDLKMSYFAELIFANDGFKRDFAELLFADAEYLIY